MSLLNTAKLVGRMIVQLSPLLADYADTIKKWRKKEDARTGEDVPSRIERLEQNLELQSRLNEQFMAEMKVLKSLIEAFNRRITIAFALSLLAAMLSIITLIALFSR